MCQMFQTTVHSRWKACSLAELPFVYYLNALEAEVDQSISQEPTPEIEKETPVLLETASL